MPEKLSRRSFVRGTATAAAGTAGLAAASGSASAIVVTSSVYTTTALNVREYAGTGYAVKATADQYTGGYVVDGPVSADGYTWWKVRYNEDSDNAAVTGWSAEGNGWLVQADFGYPASGTVTSTYYDSRSYGYHSAVDVAYDYGIAIRACRGGTVSVVGWDPDGYGSYVMIDHGGGWETLYGHMQSVYVSEGQSVAWDEQIGEMGSTGNSSGPHVHYEIRNGGATQYVPPDESLEGSWFYERTGVPRNYF